ncbi:MAG: hypothetical protein KTR35_00745 [Gammaproteobacteria bacterium]|nr:hypothetical protein [Gammaproteobacteria bacterium]
MRKIHLCSAFAVAIALTGCVTPTLEVSLDEKVAQFAPRIALDESILETSTSEELRQLRLVATNLVSVLVQIPEMQPGVTTAQVAKPRNTFGHSVIRALEDAGFGLQLVSADQGNAYVSYGRRSADTDLGLVTDYLISVNDLQLSREYRLVEDNVYPTSLMKISGTRYLSDLEVDDSIFKEQGGTNDVFISGLTDPDSQSQTLAVQEVRVNDYDELPDSQKTPQSQVLARARQRYFEADTQRHRPDLSALKKYRRSVLVFENQSEHIMGDANKDAIRLMVREFRPQDVYVIKACIDVDGKNDLALARAVRVEEELLSHGIPARSAFIAPCARASYRHPSDNSPIPVELVHYRGSAS